MEQAPSIPESTLWIAELDYLTTNDVKSRSAQFAIRTAERAQCLAKAAATNPVDELLDARDKVSTPEARSVLECAIRYIRADQSLDRELFRAGWDL